MTELITTLQNELEAVIGTLTREASNIEDMHTIFVQENWEDKRVAAINLFYQEPYKSLCMTALWMATLLCGSRGKRQEKYDTLYAAFPARTPLNWYHVAKALHRAPLPANGAIRQVLNGLRLLANTLEKTSTEDKIQEVMRQAREQAIVNEMVNRNPFDPALYRIYASSRITRGPASHW